MKNLVKKALSGENRNENTACPVYRTFFVLKLYENGKQYVAHYVVLVLCYDMKYLVAGNQMR